MIVIVTGGRNYTNTARVVETLEALNPSAVVHGGATGADAIAYLWAQRADIPEHTYNANWGKHGRAAGPIRNALMLDSHPEALVVAFPGGKGTANCILQARSRGMRVLEIDRG